MKTIGPLQSYEFTITELRTYAVLGDGHTQFEAEQDAVERFHRLRKSGDMNSVEVSRPKVIKSVMIRSRNR